MKGKPILFNGPMVRALLEGRKTQTRRVVLAKHKPFPWRERHADTPFCQHTWPARRIGMHCPDCAAGIPSLCPHGQPGDLLWVRETWAAVNTEGGPAWAYRADKEVRQPEYDGHDFGAGPSFNYDKYPGDYCMWVSDLLAGEPDHRWTPSIHMPKWASRLTLRIIDVRVERVQDITREDAAAEGLGSLNTRVDSVYSAWDSDPLDEFCELWNSLNARRAGCSWSDNPWVWVLSFDVLRRNIDEVQS